MMGKRSCLKPSNAGSNSELGAEASGGAGGGGDLAANNEAWASPYEPWTVDQPLEQTIVEKVLGFDGVVLPHTPVAFRGGFWRAADAGASAAAGGCGRR